MENYHFETGGLRYLCILGSDGVDFDCYACTSEDEVFEVISERIFDEIEWVTNNYTDFSHWDPEQEEEIIAYIDMLKAKKVIKNPAILKQCYDEFFADSWWFTVIDDCGDEWFGYHL